MIVADIDECYDKHSEALLRFAASQVGGSDAEDVLAAAVLGVLQHQGGEIVDMRAYLYRAVANGAAKHWRSADRRKRRQAFLLGPSSVASVDAHFGRSSEILSAIAELSVQQRAVVHLTYWEDLTPGMVASRLGVSDGTVRRHLARARQRLRSVIDDQ